MTKAFLHGFAVGLPLALLIGPVLFTLLQGSLRHGWRGGLAAAIGIIVSDIIMVEMLLWGLGDWLLKPHVQLWLGGMAIFLLLGLGIRYLLTKGPISLETQKVGAKQVGGWFMQGFLVNFVNPFVFAVWIGFLALATESHGEIGRRAFMWGILASIFITDSAKAFFAGRLLRLLTPTRLLWLYRGIGGFLIIAAGVVAWQMGKELGYV